MLLVFYFIFKIKNESIFWNFLKDFFLSLNRNMAQPILNIDAIIQSICDGKIILSDIFKSNQIYKYVFCINYRCRFLKTLLKFRIKRKQNKISVIINIF